MIKRRESRLFEILSDLGFLTFLYIIMADLIYNHTVIYGYGVPIPNRETFLYFTIFGVINQYNFFMTIFYLPMYIFKISLRDNIVLILGLFLYTFGMYGLSIFRKIAINITGVNSKSVILISSYLSMFILVFFPFNVYNLGHLVATQYITPMIQIFSMYSVVLEIIYILVYLSNIKEIIKHLFILFTLLLFINYQSFPASLLIYVLVLILTTLLNDRANLYKPLMLLAVILLFDAFGALFEINIYKINFYTSYLPEYKLPLNSNYHTYFLWGLFDSVSWIDYIYFAINHFSFAFLLGDWNFNYIFLNNQIDKNSLGVYIFYFSLVNLISALPFLVLKFYKKINTLIFSYFILIIIITVLGPQISVWTAETNTELGNIASYAYDAPTTYEPILQILIAILVPLSLLVLQKLWIKNKYVIITSMLSLTIILFTSSYGFFMITAYNTSSNFNQSNEILNYLEHLGFPKTYFLLENDNSQNEYLLSMYPNNQIVYLFSLYNRTYIYYVLGYSLGYPGFSTLNYQTNPKIVSYILNYFGFKYIVTDQEYLAKIYNNSGLFKIIYKNDYYYILKIKPINYNLSDIFLSTSTRVLTSLLNNNTYPIWLSQPYMYNLTIIESLAKNHTIYVPWYFNVYELYTYVPYKYVINFAHYNINNFNNNEWKSAFCDFWPQQTWGQNYLLFNSYQYQNFLAPNYGVIYSDNPNTSFVMNYNVPNGRYILISQILYSNIGGEVDFIINNNVFAIPTKSNNGSYFAFTYIGEVNVSDNSLKIEIVNKSGFNAIEVMYIIPYNIYIKYYNELNDLANTFKKVYS